MIWARGPLTSRLDLPAREAGGFSADGQRPQQARIRRVQHGISQRRRVPVHVRVWWRRRGGRGPATEVFAHAPEEAPLEEQDELPLGEGLEGPGDGAQDTGRSQEDDPLAGEVQAPVGSGSHEKFQQFQEAEQQAAGRAAGARGAFEMLGKEGVIKGFQGRVQRSQEPLQKVCKG